MSVAAVRHRIDPGLRTAIWFVVVTAIVSVPLWWVQPRTPEIAAAVPVASLAPLAGAIAIWLRGDRGSLRHWWQSIREHRGMIIRRTVLALGAGLGVVLTLIQARTLLEWNLMPFNMVALPVPLAVVALIMIVPVAAQEIGWRGVLEPSLRPVLGEPTAVVLTGIAWGVWTLPGLGFIGVPQIALLIIATIALSVVIDRLLRGVVAGRLIVATGFRWALAMGLLVFGDEEAGVVPALAIVAAASVLAAVVAMFAPRIVRWSAGGGRDLLAG